jgi:hypothetical protein
VISALALRPQITHVNRLALFIDARRSRNQQDRDVADVDPQAARERTRPAVTIGLVQDVQVGHGPLFDGHVRLQQFAGDVFKFHHGLAPKSLRDYCVLFKPDG